MGRTFLLADGGATKTEWKLIKDGKGMPSFKTTGISPYHMSGEVIENVVRKEFSKNVLKLSVDYIFYYGTGCKTKKNAAIVRKALGKIYPKAVIEVTHDLMGASIALCGKKRGIACILGTGSNSCYFNGKRIVRNSPGLGYVLGDEGSGFYLGKKVVQHYLYEAFDDSLRKEFESQFKTSRDEILLHVYKEPYANRYLAQFARFLSANRGHYMIENIIEDGLRDFFDTHLKSYAQTNSVPIHFVGSVAFYFKDKIAELCMSYGFTLGKILKTPMKGLVEYHIN
jgi:N-acetylglucosamine kinase-like BadF-type ATPase